MVEFFADLLTPSAFATVYIMEKLQHCTFFDDEIKTSIFYPTLHDAMLHILETHPDHGELEKVVRLMQIKYFDIT